MKLQQCLRFKLGAAAAAAATIAAVDNFLLQSCAYCAREKRFSTTPVTSRHFMAAAAVHISDSITACNPADVKHVLCTGMPLQARCALCT